MAPCDPQEQTTGSIRLGRRSRGLGLWVALPLVATTLVATTCAPPIQSGGVIVAGGATERLGTLCRWRHGGAESNDLCPSGAPAQAQAARVRRLAGGDGLAGPLAIGRAGDYMLENEEVAFVVDQLGPGSGFAESGGNLVDAADARVRRDELGQIFTYFGVFPRQALYDDLKTGVDDDGTAWIEVRGRELRDEALRVITRYALRPGDRALLLTTTLERVAPAGGDAPPATSIDLGDVVQWGATEKIAPGKEPGFRGDFTGPYIAGVGDQVAYALVPASGEDMTAKNGGAWSNVSFARGVNVAPGKRVTYARVLAVAPRGDPLGVATELLVLGGAGPGALALELTDARGTAMAIPGKASLSLVNDGAPGRLTAPSAPSPVDKGGDVAKIPLWLRTGSPVGAHRPDPPAEIPPGRYRVGFEGNGRRARKEIVIEVRPGEVTAARLVLDDGGRLALSVREVVAAAGGPLETRATPAKISIFDAATGAPSSPPRFTAGRDLDLPLAPGRYRVVASRGPELSLGEGEVEIAAGSVARLELTLSRVVDTTGYLACDLHQHTALSADAGVSLVDRVLSNVAEGVECAVASEHNLVADLSPVARDLGLADRFRSIAGQEITSDASRAPFGHVNVFPMPLDPADARGGALRVRDRTAKDLFDAARALPGERVIQINHPRSGDNGYFDRLAFDPTIGAGAAPDYDARFDAVEVWSGRYVAGRARVLDDLWGLLRASHPVTPTANTDTHGIVRAEPGYPRTYVAVGDDPARLDPAALVDALRRRRDVVLTNGPFVTARIGDVRQGGLASLDRRGRAAITVRVERAPWVDASALTLWVGGVAGDVIPLSGSTRTPSGALVDEITVPLLAGKPPAAPVLRAAVASRPAPIRIPHDTFVVAVVQGERPLEPVLTGPPDEIRPFAMTAPLWIDADGDGRALGRGPE